MSFFSEKLNKFKPSLTVKISQKARELKRVGKEIVSLSSGEPDFDTPLHIKQKAISAINEGFTKYTAVDGVISLKEAIVEKFKIDNLIEYNTEQITVGVGGKHVIYNLFMSTLNTNDEVIIPSPYWVSYPEIVSLCGGKPIIIETNEDENFKISANKLEKAINKNTKWVIVNSPSNPTGSVYTKTELSEIAKVLMKHENVWILSDDIYEHIIYDDYEFYNIINVEPSLYERSFIVNGVSKAYSMTGWRIGYGAGSKELINCMSKIQSQSTTNPSSISQMAAIAALSSNKEFLKDWIDQFTKRREFVFNSFNQIKGLKCLKPKGAFYLFVSCQGLLSKKRKNGQEIKSDLDFADYLLEQAGVAVVPGVAFGKSPYFRISYASSMKQLDFAIKRIKEAVSHLE